MGFLAICSQTDCNGKAAMGFLAICSHTDCNGDSLAESVLLQMARNPMAAFPLQSV